jgi:4-alpha-glucanotransferase
VRYPADDLLAIVAVESQRATSTIVGEDLGTVEQAARRALAAHAILSYRLLWFEPNDPSEWPSKALAAVTTHDLPTVAGLWDGSDVANLSSLGLNPDVAATEAIRSRLARTANLAPTATAAEAVAGAHELLARAPAVLLSAIFDDAVTATERPNIPGTDGRRPNWSLALSATIDEIETHPLAIHLAAVLDDATHDAQDDTSSGSP